MAAGGGLWWLEQAAAVSPSPRRAGLCGEARLERPVPARVGPKPAWLSQFGNNSVCKILLLRNTFYPSMMFSRVGRK